jgi:hypothetical protein
VEENVCFITLPFIPSRQGREKEKMGGRKKKWEGERKIMEGEKKIRMGDKLRIVC